MNENNRFWSTMDHRPDLKRTDKIMIGNSDNMAPNYVDVSEILGPLTTDDLPEGANNKYGGDGLSPSWLHLQANRVLSLNDAGLAIYNSSANDYEVTLPSEADASFGEDVAFTFWSESTGKIKVKPASGVTAPACETTEPYKVMTYLRRGADNWICIGTFNNWNPVSIPASADTPELIDWFSAENLAESNQGEALTTLSGSKGVLTASVIGGVTLNLDGQAKEIQLDGSTGALNLGQPASLNFVPGTDTFTFMIELGVNKPTSGVFLSKGVGSTNRQYQMGIQDSNSLYLSSGGTERIPDLPSGQTFSSTRFIFLTVGVSDMTPYQEDTSLGAQTRSGTTVATGIDVLIGARRNVNDNTGVAFNLNGSVKKFAFWTGELSAQTITNIISEL
jgi:hypothetical protein